ncbi:Fe-S protein assembly co-chaperone HscB [Azospirillum rugosum]|uniref:Molecular chaperone HscB n=1 Tax=Azospirillum rugosum TaxID=416170 RepID=A0ABS4SNR7_9PROT|nr:Fe-S protein assembly co-chaperone HscB [Azospirillum rugosum]MBP2294206.1 molecular chaperone HscB [Azospirillum rugosum]MDQ0527405.1 molecular chaperone HscB [Azospirillum rugosum]
MTTSDSGPPRFPAGNGIAGAIDGDLEPCWQCGRSVAARAFFCHSCGAVQPPRPLDHFTRLGLEARFDIDLETLARQHAGFSRSLDPDRFAARGARQQANARAQSDALTEAFETLRDPVRRARYLLALTGATPPPGLEAAADEVAEDEEVAALARQLDAAQDVAAVDRLAAEVGQRIESCIKYLAIAFRNGQTDNAVRILARLERLEALCADARRRRAGLAPNTP